MPHRYIGRKITAALLMLSLIPAAMTGCANNDWEVGESELRASQTLCGVEYCHTGGSVYGQDITIILRDKELVYASYFPWEGTDDYLGDGSDCITVENVPLEEGRWNEIEKAIEDILPILKRKDIEKKGIFRQLLSRIFAKNEDVMDGEGSFSFAVVWRDDENGAELSVSYEIPDDKRFVTLLDLMKETAHPIGREIVWYNK